MLKAAIKPTGHFSALALNDNSDGVFYIIILQLKYSQLERLDRRSEMVSEDNSGITCRTTLKSATKAIGQIILGLLAIALLMASSIGFFYGLVLAGSGKDLLGGVLLTIVCNTFIFVIYEVGKRYLLSRKPVEPEW